MFKRGTVIIPPMLTMLLPGKLAIHSLIPLVLRVVTTLVAPISLFSVKPRTPMLLPTPVTDLVPMALPALVPQGRRRATQLDTVQTLPKDPITRMAGPRFRVVPIDRKGLQLTIPTLRETVTPVIPILTVFKLITFKAPFKTLGFVKVFPFPLIRPGILVLPFPRAPV